MCLTAYALILQAGIFKKEKLALVAANLKAAASAFLLYGFFGGIIVPKAGFFPAAVFNFDSFRNITGIPVQIFRAAAACVITYNMLKVLGVFHWEAKKTEEILRMDKETFEKMVQENSQQLIEAERELDKASRLADMGMFAASVAHELRNPLAAIQMAAYNIKKKDAGALLEKHISNIEKKVAESDQIINNLLFYARLKNAYYERISIYDVLDECIDNAEKRFEQQNIAISRNFANIREIVLDADPLQMRELFNNIFNNAFDAVSDKEGKIEIRGEQVDDSHMAIYIKDNGIGIDEENLKKIYDPFFTTKSKGTGLGLTVASQIVYLHHGRMNIQSKKGEWTEVTVVLPVKKKQK
jgi:signal transduction histidine kinase